MLTWRLGVWVVCAVLWVVRLAAFLADFDGPVADMLTALALLASAVVLGDLVLSGRRRR